MHDTDRRKQNIYPSIVDRATIVRDKKFVFIISKISILLSKFFNLLSYQFLEITPRGNLFKIQQNVGAWKQERRRQEIQPTMHTWKVNGIRMKEQNFWYHFVVNNGLWNCTNLMSVFSRNRQLYLYLGVVISGNFAIVDSCQLNSIHFRGSRKKRLIHVFIHYHIGFIAKCLIH
jgi:hypothetical protein